jgi:signal peptidase I
MSFFYFYLLILVHPYLSLWWMSFPKAGRKSWEALIPGYNYFVMFKITCDKPFWSLLMLFPGVHLIMLATANVSYLRRFGYYSFADTLQGILFPYLLMYKVTQEQALFGPETNWSNSRDTEIRKWGDHIVLFLCLPVIGHVIALAIGAVTREQPGVKSRVKEWGDSILFALVAASIIRTYVFEPFQIPTGSMEKTLLVGDFLFVNKLAYGPKVPVTPLSYPLVHNTVPWINIKSYTTLEKGSYTRLPGFGKVKLNDVVVFNFPSGDTAVYDPRMPTGLMGHDYHGVVINEAKRLFSENFENEIQIIANKLADSIKKSNPQERYDEAKLYQFTRNIASSEILIQKSPLFIKDIEKWKNKARKMLAEDKIAMDMFTGEIINHFGLVYRPVDKRENYIKRCVGLPGNRIKIVNSVLFVNGKKSVVSPQQCLLYKIEKSKVSFPGAEEMASRYGLENDPSGARTDFDALESDEYYILNLTSSEKNNIERDFKIKHLNIDNYCKKDFETGLKLGGHMITCESNPTRNQTIDKIRNSNKGKKTSEESKEKISNSMKLAHLEGKAWNIGKSRWNNQPSYPEEFFMKVIDNNFSNKEYTREYPVGIYSIDFAWIESKKCIEIDGDQHQRFEEYRKRDERKDKLLKEEGWEILRIKWKDLYQDPSNWIEKSYQFIHTER